MDNFVSENSNAPLPAQFQGRQFEDHGILYHNLRTQRIGLSSVFTILRMLVFPQKCHTTEQNSKWQRIKLLNMAILSLQFIKGDSLFSTFKWFPALKKICWIWTSKFNLESKLTPSSFTWSSISFSTQFMNIAWDLSGLASTFMSVYVHLWPAYLTYQ